MGLALIKYLTVDEKIDWRTELLLLEFKAVALKFMFTDTITVTLYHVYVCYYHIGKFDLLLSLIANISSVFELPNHLSCTLIYITAEAVSQCLRPVRALYFNDQHLLLDGSVERYKTSWQY